MLGRVVGIACSIAGIFFLAMIFVFLVLYLTLDDEEHQVSNLNLNIKKLNQFYITITRHIKKLSIYTRKKTLQMLLTHTLTPTSVINF